jgi:hypothetical protein
VAPDGRFDVPGVEERGEGVLEAEAHGRSAARDQAGRGTHRQGARWREASPQEVATWTAPRRVSVTTSSETSRPSLIPTPAKPMPCPRTFVVAARSW